MHLNLFTSISGKFPLRAYEFAWSGRCQARPFPRRVDSIYESIKKQHYEAISDIDVQEFTLNQLQRRRIYFCPVCLSWQRAGGRQSVPSYLSVSAFLTNLSGGRVVSTNYPPHISHISPQFTIVETCELQWGIATSRSLPLRSLHTPSSR